MSTDGRTLTRLPGTPEPSWRATTSDGLTIAVDEWGPSDGDAIVLLHGGGQTRHAWRGLGARLGERGWRALALDLRGHGDSSWAEDGVYTYDAFVGDLQAVLRAGGPRAPVFVGASLGGAIALAGVGEQRLLAAGLVIVDTAPQLESDGVAELHAFMTSRPDGYASPEEAADAIAAYTGRPRQSSVEGLRKNLRVDEAGRYHWHWDPDFLGGNGSDPAARQQRLERAAQALTLPTLLVRGARSDMLSEEGARAFLAHCPHSEYVNIAGASHMVAGDRNDQFGDAVLDFCERTLGTPSGQPARSPSPDDDDRASPPGRAPEG